MRRPAFPVKSTAMRPWPSCHARAGGTRTTDMDSIESLKQLLHSHFDVAPADMDPDAPFAQYNLDSLTLAELMFVVEDAVHVQVSDEAMSTVTNLRGLARMVDELRAVRVA